MPLYVDFMRNLYHTSKDPIELMCWTEIYIVWKNAAIIVKMSQIL